MKTPARVRRVQRPAYLPPELAADLDRLQQETRVPRSHLIQDAVELLLAFHAGVRGLALEQIKQLQQEEIEQMRNRAVADPR